MSVFVAAAVLHQRFTWFPFGLSITTKHSMGTHPCYVQLPPDMPQPPDPPVTLPVLVQWIEENEDIELHWRQDASHIRYMWDRHGDTGMIVAPYQLQHHPVACVDFLAQEIVHHYSLRTNMGDNRWLRGLAGGRNECIAEKMQCAFLLPLQKIGGMTASEVADRWEVLPQRAERAIKIVWEYKTYHHMR